MNKTQKIGSSFWVIITIIPIFGLLLGIVAPEGFYGLQTYLREWIGQFGNWGIGIFIIVQILQVVLAPISHYVVGLVGGYLYGAVLGGVLNWIGRVIGHIVVFIIARRYGRRILKKYVKENILKRYDKFFSGESAENETGQKVSYHSLILFLIYFLPLFPDDEISYLVGASKMSSRLFILANIFGHLGGAFSLAYIGSGIDTKDILFWVLFIATLAGFPIIWFLLYLLQKKRIKV